MENQKQKDPKEIAYDILTYAIEIGLQNGIYGVNDIKQIIGALDIVALSMFRPAMQAVRGGKPEGKQVDMKGETIKDVQHEVGKKIEEDAKQEGEQK